MFTWQKKGEQDGLKPILKFKKFCPDVLVRGGTKKSRVFFKFFWMDCGNLLGFERRKKILALTEFSQKERKKEKKKHLFVRSHASHISNAGFFLSCTNFAPFLHFPRFFFWASKKKIDAKKDFFCPSRMHSPPPPPFLEDCKETLEAKEKEEPKSFFAQQK